MRSDRLLGRGVTRSAYQVGRWAVKIPNRGWWIRGWMANQSEWKQRRRCDVARPVLTMFHVALIMPRAAATMDEFLGRHGWGDLPPLDSEDGVIGYDGDEAKLTSWGLFHEGWLLIDFDRAWEQPRRGLFCRAYYWNQERLARKWARLPEAT